MFKFILGIFLAVIVLVASQTTSNQPLTVQEKHQIFMQKHEQTRIEKEKKKKIEILKSSSFSKLQTASDKISWIALNMEKGMAVMMLFLISFFVVLNKFKKINLKIKTRE